MIKEIKLFPAFNSRGEKTVKVVLKNEKHEVWSIAPSGASKSTFEPFYLPVDKILEKKKEIENLLLGKTEKDVDKILAKHAGKRFEKIGGNLTITLSQASWKLIWKDCTEVFTKKPIFPIPLSNILGGGAHGGFTSIQEFLVFPKNPKSILEAVEKNVQARKMLKQKLKKKFEIYGRNDEGALVAKVNDYDALELLAEVAEELDMFSGIDMAATQFYSRGEYEFAGKKYSREEFVDVVVSIAKTYKLRYIEDPFHEKDFTSFSELTKKLKRALICVDDIYSTNAIRLKKGIGKKAGNSIIIKPNQVGTVSLALKTVGLAKENGFVSVASHRSGETEDPFIAELCIFAQIPMLKCSVSGSERFAKWNKLIELWQVAEKPRMNKIK